MNNVVVPNQNNHEMNQGQDHLESLIDKREDALSKIHQIQVLMSELNQIELDDVGTTRLTARCQKAFDFYNAGRPNSELATNLIDQIFWNHALEKGGLADLLTTNSCWSLREKIEQESPEFSRDNVYSTMYGARDNAANILADSIVELFEKLPSRFKTNDEFGFKQKLIFEKVVAYDSYYESYAADLDRFAHLVSGRALPERYDDRLVGAIHKNFHTGDFEFETEFFEVKLFLNGNAHIKFKKTDLLDVLNNVLARHFGQTLTQRTAQRG